ncbi:MAG TPA: chorismate mutase [Pyrinomonadaceae bacterium]|nr:chorismate mutase [Pyrinomonadaceae bacterium]
MNIEHWRNEIDEIDAELLRLLNMRARLALKVGALKKQAQLPLCDPVRERSVLLRLSELNAGPLDDRAINKVFRRIIRESRRLEVVIDNSEGLANASAEVHQSVRGIL